MKRSPFSHLTSPELSIVKDLLADIEAIPLSRRTAQQEDFKKRFEKIIQETKSFPSDLTSETEKDSFY